MPQVNVKERKARVREKIADAVGLHVCAGVGYREVGNSRAEAKL